MSKLSETLGVKEGQEFSFGMLECKMSENGAVIYYKEEDSWNLLDDGDTIYDIINFSEKILIIPDKVKLTYEQKISIKGRITEGWLWVAREYDGPVYCYIKKPNFDQDYYCYCSNDGLISQANISIFNFVKYGECLYLPDLIAGEEE